MGAPHADHTVESPGQHLENHQCPRPIPDHFSENLGDKGTVGYRHSPLQKLPEDSRSQKGWTAVVGEGRLQNGRRGN